MRRAGVTMASPTPDKIPLRIIASYSLLSFALEATSTMWTTFELFFITDVAFLSPSLAAWVAIIYRLWAGFNDPIVGNFTDKTINTKWGRRRGWLVFAVIPYAALFCSVWVVPGTNQWVMLFYFLFTKCATDFAWTCLRVPHNALVNDLSPDYGERYRLNIIRSAATGLGSIFSTVLAAGLSKAITNQRIKFPTQAGALNLIMIGATLLLVHQTRGYSTFVPTKEENRGSLFARCRDIFKVRAAILVIIITAFSSIALQTTVTLVPYLLEDTLGLTDFEVTIMVVTVSVSGLITVVLIMIFAKKWEKRTVYAIGASVWTLFYLGIPLVSKTTFWYMLPLAGFMGCGVGVSLLIPNSLVTDAADFTELETGLKLEGTIYGLVVMINKFLLGFVIFIFQEILSATGFDLKSPVKSSIPAKAKQAIMIMIIVFPAFFLLCTLAANYFLPINKKKMYEIGEQLQRSRGLSSDESEKFLSDLEEDEAGAHEIQLLPKSGVV
eukprot:TRINITY_DN6625_c0_g1_i1.p1 TRINITY_DN6625_c0_g1~~TRINITY_DN6625_c0_g1_i1.p1  ORF type:complete len:496 (+),score=108.98 TRINITY_DN6625_c0_g1_i1:412-1899(+)